MKFGIIRSGLFTAILAFAAFAIGCGDGSNNTAGSGPQKIDDTLEAAYTRLYDAVKKKDTAAIGEEMSQETLKFAAGASARMKKPVEEVLANGFTATTFSDTIPEMRDPRIKDNFGAIEVWNAKDQVWEDVLFVGERGKWKLAYGDAFSNKFKSPGKGQAMRDREAANAAGATPNAPNAGNNSNSNTNVKAVEVEPEAKASPKK